MTTQQRNDIEKAIQSMEAGCFQEFILRFMPLYDTRYEGMLRNGHNEEGKTCRGYPDLVKIDVDGHQIACECSTEKSYWSHTNDKKSLEKSKPIKDLKKCLASLEKLKEIVLVSSRPVPSSSPNCKTNIITYKSPHDCMITVLGSQDLAAWIELKIAQPRVLQLVDEYFPEATRMQRLIEKTERLSQQHVDENMYCYLRLENFRENIANFFIHSIAKRTLKIFQCRVFDLKTSFDIVRISNIEMPGNKALWYYQCQVNLGNKLEQKFNVFWITDCGDFTQLLRLKMTSSGWVQAVRVISEDRIIEDIVDPGFPRDQMGQVCWD